MAWRKNERGQWVYDLGPVVETGGAATAQRIQPAATVQQIQSPQAPRSTPQTPLPRIQPVGVFRSPAKTSGGFNFGNALRDTYLRTNPFTALSQFAKDTRNLEDSLTQGSISRVPVVGDVTKDVGGFIKAGTAPIRAIPDLVRGGVQELQGNKEAAQRSYQQAQADVNRSAPYRKSEEIKAHGGGVAEQFFRPAVSEGAKAASYVVPASRTGKIATSSIKSLAGLGGAAGATYEAGKQINEGKFDPKSLAITTGVGAVAGPVAKPIAKVAGKLGDRLKVRPKDTEQTPVKVPESPQVKAPKVDVPVARTRPIEVQVGSGKLSDAPVPGQEGYTGGPGRISTEVKPRITGTGTDYVTAQRQLEDLAGNPKVDITKQPGRVSVKAHALQDTAADTVTHGATGIAGRALRSQNPVVHTVGELLYGLSKKSTLADTEKRALERFYARRGGFGKGLGTDLENSINAPLSSLDEAAQAKSKDKVFDAFLRHGDGDAKGAQQVIKSFSKEERQLFDNLRGINKVRNQLNRGIMDDEVIALGEEGMHMPRLYDFSDDDIETYAMTSGKALDLNPNKRRKQLDEISDEIKEKMVRDPAQATVIRTEIALHNRAVREYSDFISGVPDAVSDTKLRGYIEVPNNSKYGDLAGKFVRKDLAGPMMTGSDRFESGVMQNVDALFNKYHESALGKIESALRQVLTVFNPATRLGNRSANIVMGQLQGMNFPELAARQQHWLSTLVKGGDEMTRFAQTHGLQVGDDAFLRLSGAERLAKEGSWFRGRQESYRSVDDGARMALFEWQLKKGANPEDAARFANRALPNIANSGEIYWFFSRLPILGIPFRAIQPEIVRALSSAMGRRTVPFLAAMAAYTTFQNWTWKGVPEDERKQIQERFGAGQTPFAKLNEVLPGPDVLPSSWSFNAGKFVGSEDPIEVDPRRLAGIYSINTAGDAAGGVLDEARKFSPAPIPFQVKDGKLDFQEQEVVGSRLGQPIYQALIDKDFRGKSISDPTNVTYDEKTGTKKYPDDLSTTDKAKNIARRLAVSYGPVGNDADAILSSALGKPNTYGDERSLGESAARATGLKVESFDQEKLDEMKGKEVFFEGNVKRVQKFLEDNPDLAASYYKFNSPTRDRETGKKVSDLVTPERWKVVAADSSGRLYEFLKNEAVAQEKENGRPIDPLFQLAPDQVKEVLELRSRPSGDDIEREEILRATQPWYAHFETDERAYYDANTKYWDSKGITDTQNERVKKYGAVPYPEQSDIMKQYYAVKAQDANAAKQFFKANANQLSSDFDSYRGKKLDYTNAKRQIEGFSPIEPRVFDNVTFGYEDDENDVMKTLKGKQKAGKINMGMTKNAEGAWVPGQSSAGGFGFGSSGGKKRRGGGGGRARISKVKAKKPKISKAKSPRSSITARKPKGSPKARRGGIKFSVSKTA